MEMAQNVPTGTATDSHIVARNSIVLLTRYLAVAGMNAVLVLFLPRYLGDTGLGQLQFALSFASLFVPGVALGVRQFLIKEVARDRSQVPNYLGSAIGLRLVTAGLVFSVIIIFSHVDQRLHEARWVLYMAALGMIATAFAHLMATVLNGLEDMTGPAAGEILDKLVVVAAGIIVLVLGLGVLAYACVLLAGALAQFAFNATYLNRRFPLRLDFCMPRIKMLVLGGMPYLLMGFLLNVYHHTDVVMLRFYTQSEVVGWYAAALQLYRSVEFLPAILTTALLPTLARVHSTSPDGLAVMARKSIAVGVVVIVPLALGISLLSDEVIRFLPYPESFQNSALLLRILALTIPVTAMLTILGTIAVAVDRQRAWAIALLGTVALNVVLNAVSIPYFQRVYGNGAIAASIATVISEGFMVMVGVRLMPRGVINKELGALLLKVALAGGVMVTIGMTANALGTGAVSLAVAGAVAYIALVFATRAVTGADVMFMREAALRRVQLLRRSG